MEIEGGFPTSLSLSQHKRQEAPHTASAVREREGEPSRSGASYRLYALAVFFRRVQMVAAWGSWPPAFAVWVCQKAGGLFFYISVNNPWGA
jgi:hypothetical protein